MFLWSRILLVIAYAKNIVRYYLDQIASTCRGLGYRADPAVKPTNARAFRLQCSMRTWGDYEDGQGCHDPAAYPLNRGIP